MSQILPPSLRGLMFAALAGAVMSSFNSGINSASTIFTIDVYKRYFRRDATPEQEVRVGRVATAAIVVVACLWAPVISGFRGVFNYIQEIWGFLSPGIVAAFLVGLAVRKAPPLAAKGALWLGVALYALCRVPRWVMRGTLGWESPDAVPAGLLGALYRFGGWSFLHHMGLVFLVLVLFMLVVTRLRPLPRPRELPVSGLDVRPHPRQYALGALVIAATAVLYVLFW
jgi:SSS family solute:Na+ symporter